MFGFKKRRLGSAPPATAADDGTELRYSAALLAIARSGWPDIEEAKTVAAQIALLASVELEPVAPEFKSKYAPVQRAIAAALYVGISKSGVKNLGKESLVRIVEGTREFARQSGEMRFYNSTGKALRIF